MAPWIAPTGLGSSFTPPPATSAALKDGVSMALVFLSAAIQETGVPACPLVKVFCLWHWILSQMKHGKVVVVVAATSELEHVVKSMNSKSTHYT